MVQTMDLELVYRACFTKVYNYFFYRLLHREAAEDLTSQTFLRMVERFHTYDTGRGQIEPWLFRIAERVLIDYYREKKMSLSLDSDPLLEPSITFEEEYQKLVAPQREALYRALTRLPARDRTLLYRKYLLGESYHRIAGDLHMNESTLASALQRAKKKAETAVGAGWHGIPDLIRASLISRCPTRGMFFYRIG